jgi:hypothetical protein
MRWRRLPVEDTPLGQSLAGKVERGALKLLDEHRAAMPTGERAAQVAMGYHNGYQIHWCLTGSHLLILPVVRVPGAEFESISRGTITGVQTRGPVRRHVRVRAGDGYQTVEGDRLEAWDRVIAELMAWTRQTVAAEVFVFSSDGAATFSGEHVPVRVEYLGGHPGLAEPAKLLAVFDDEALHLLSIDGCIERLRVDWGDVAELVIDGIEETQRRISAARLLAVGMIALAFPKVEQHDRAYITLNSAEWTLVLRADQVSPYEARLQLGHQIRRVGAAGAADVRSAGLTDALSRVFELHRQGALTDGEFAEAKRQILQGP